MKLTALLMLMVKLDCYCTNLIYLVFYLFSKLVVVCFGAVVVGVATAAGHGDDVVVGPSLQSLNSRKVVQL